jgi:hypothetical protein
MKKILIITYYWPPAAGPGVHRILKFSKYLPEFGWKPIILTVNEGAFPAQDATLLNDIPESCVIYKSNSFEPFSLYKKFIGMKKEDSIPDSVLLRGKANWKKKFADWVRLNIFIPDAKIGWLINAVKKGKEIVNIEKPDAIFSTSPPSTVHLIAKKIAASEKIPWVADFRDPWTEVFYYENRARNFIANYIDKKLENSVLESADRIVVVSDGFFNQNDSGINQKTRRLPNGFDLSDFEKFYGKAVEKNEKFTICYMGSLKPHQYIDSFFSVISMLSKENKYKNKFCLEFAGAIDPTIKAKIDEKEISFPINYHGYINHSDAISFINRADMLLLIIGKSKSAPKILSSKLFEYLAVKKPILAYGPVDGEASKIMKETNCGKMFNYDETDDAKEYILDTFNNWQENNNVVSIDLDMWKKYNRKSLTENLVKIIEEIT